MDTCLISITYLAWKQQRFLKIGEASILKDKETRKHQLKRENYIFYVLLDELFICAWFFGGLKFYLVFGWLFHWLLTFGFLYGHAVKKNSYVVK